MNKNQANRLLVVNMASCADYDNEEGMSGGERITLECLRYWINNFKDTTIFSDDTWARKCNKYLSKPKNIIYLSIKIQKFLFKFLPILYIYKIFKSILIINKLKIANNTYLLSASDIFPDTLVSLYLKIKNPRVKWVAAFYFFASTPFTKEFPYKSYVSKIRGTIYWASQQICYKLILKYADHILACNDIDAKIIAKDGFSSKKISIVYGGVNVEKAIKAPEQEKIYDAVFLGRFHAQKGPVEAAKVWKEYLKYNMDGKLVMIGNGPEEVNLNRYIQENKLENSIKLHITGFAEDQLKYKFFKSSKVFLHTAIYETGGMVAAEGMAAGLPVVGFNHPGFKYIFPKGIDKSTEIGDCKQLAKVLNRILTDKAEYGLLKQEALSLVKEKWDWEKRADYIYKDMMR